MEEIRCSLLGYGGADLDPHKLVSARLQRELHPSELAVVLEAMPMGVSYASLRNFCTDVAVGSARVGHVGSSIAAGSRKILAQYEEAVTSLESVTALHELRLTYLAPLKSLSRVAESSTVSDQLRRSHRFITNLDHALIFRSTLGEAMSMAALFHIAQWVAHGELLRRNAGDFFVMHDEDSQMYVIDENRLPPAVSDRLAAAILLAGQERATLIKERESLATSPQSGDKRGSKERKKKAQNVGIAEDNGNDDEDADAAQAIFQSLYTGVLCRGGALNVDELTTRVETAHRVWSRELWTSVATSSKLTDHIAALREMYLCRRGDLWTTFTELAFPSICKPHVSSPLDLDRPMAQAFSQAMSMANIVDAPILCDFSISCRITATNSTSLKPEDIAEMLLKRVKSLQLNFALTRGVHLVVSAPSLRHYEELFTMHMQVKFVLQALHWCRRFVGELCKSSKLAPAYARVCAVLHTLTFILTNWAYFLQVDIQDTHYQSLRKHLDECTSVDAAAKLHDHFVHEAMNGAFFFAEDNVDDAAPVSMILESFFVMGLALYALCRRDDATVSISQRMSAEFSLSLAALESRIRRELPELQLQLAISNNSVHRALWTRLDFNRFLSSPASVGSSAPPDSARGGGKSGAARRSITSIIESGGQGPPRPSTLQAQAATVDLPDQ